MLHRHIYISIHAPTRGATDAALELNSIRVFQSTLLQEERRSAMGNATKKQFISIHAPTRGATIFHFLKLSFQLISIHAPTRGATPALLSVIQFHQISIHAPTRGATLQHVRPQFLL